MNMKFIFIVLLILITFNLFSMTPGGDNADLLLFSRLCLYSGVGGILLLNSFIPYLKPVGPYLSGGITSLYSIIAFSPIGTFEEKNEKDFGVFKRSIYFICLAGLSIYNFTSNMFDEYFTGQHACVNISLSALGVIVLGL
jgi:hypothetical protein